MSNIPNASWTNPPNTRGLGAFYQPYYVTRNTCGWMQLDACHPDGNCKAASDGSSCSGTPVYSDTVTGGGGYKAGQMPGGCCCDFKLGCNPCDCQKFYANDTGLHRFSSGRGYQNLNWPLSSTKHR